MIYTIFNSFLQIADLSLITFDRFLKKTPLQQILIIFKTSTLLDKGAF